MHENLLCPSIHHASVYTKSHSLLSSLHNGVLQCSWMHVGRRGEFTLNPSGVRLHHCVSVPPRGLNIGLAGCNISTFPAVCRNRALVLLAISRWARGVHACMRGMHARTIQQK